MTTELERLRQAFCKFKVFKKKKKKVWGGPEMGVILSWILRIP